MRALKQLCLAGLIKQATDVDERLGLKAPTFGAALASGMLDGEVRSRVGRALIGDMMDTPDALKLRGGEEWPALVRQLGREEGLDLVVRNNANRGPAYAPHWVDKLFGRRHGWKEVSGPHGAVWLPSGHNPGLDVVLHELGHAKSVHGDDLVRKLVSQARMPGAMLSGFGSLAGMGSLWFPRVSHKRKDQLLDLASLSSVGLLPTLVDEYHASKHSLDALDKLNATKRLRQFLAHPPERLELMTQQGAKLLQDDYPALRALAKKRLGRAGATYGLTALLTALTPQVAKQVMHHRDQRAGLVKRLQDR